jgi:hypothetical protein
MPEPLVKQIAGLIIGAAPAQNFGQQGILGGMAEDDRTDGRLHIR